MKNHSDQAPHDATRTTTDQSRREIMSRILGTVAGGAALSALAACSRESDPGGSSDREFAEVAQALSGENFQWVDRYDISGTGDSLRDFNGGALSSDRNVIIARGRTTPGDGAGGVFVWEHGITVGDDGGTIIVPSSPAGRWTRLVSEAVNVKWFGAYGGGADEAPQIQDAADAAAGRTLYFPKGTYVVETAIVVSADTWVRGDGWGSTVKRGGPITTSWAFTTQANSRIRFSHLCIDLNAGTNTHTGISINDGGVSSVSDMHFDYCRFINTGIATNGHTYDAILAVKVQNLSVTNCYVTRCQIHISNTGAGPGVFIKNNYLEDTFNQAISCVVRGAGEIVSDVVIEDNVIIQPGASSSNGIYLGNDSNTVTWGEFKRVTVRGNMIDIGSVADCGIVVGVCAVTEDVVVSGNVVYSSNSTAANTYGVYIRGADNGTGSFRRLTISGNHISNIGVLGVPGAAIMVQAPLIGFRIADNVIESTYGIMFDTQHAPVTRHGVIESNQLLNSLDSGIKLHVVNSREMSRVHVRDNVVANSSNGQGSAAGIFIRADEGTAVDVETSGNRCYDDRTGGSRTQNYGIEEAVSGAATYFARHKNNDVRGNIQANGIWLDGGHAQLNLGFATEARGVGVVAPALTTVMVTHNLAVQPLASDITVTPTNLPANDPGHIWVSGMNSTVFYVNCSAAPGAGGMEFEWRAAFTPPPG